MLRGSSGSGGGLTPTGRELLQVRARCVDRREASDSLESASDKLGDRSEMRAHDYVTNQHPTWRESEAKEHPDDLRLEFVERRR